MTAKFRLAILDAVPRVYWQDDEGITDAEKFLDLLRPFDAVFRSDVFYVAENEFPGSIGDYDGYLLTGSPASVHDGFDWIQRLSALVTDADAGAKRIFASCFGHQLVASVFGGEVGSNEQGWLIGNYALQIRREYEWMRPLAGVTSRFHFNQERVTRLPPAAHSFADSDAYPDFAYTLGDNVLCVQGHPEQPLRAMNNFLNSMTSDISAAERRRAREMICSGEPDADIWARWMLRFFLA